MAKEAAALALAAGLLVNAVRPDAIRVAPPLLVSDAELGRALVVLGDVVGEALDAAAGDAASAGE